MCFRLIDMMLHVSNSNAPFTPSSNYLDCNLDFSRGRDPEVILVYTGIVYTGH